MKAKTYFKKYYCEEGKSIEEIFALLEVEAKEIAVPRVLYSNGNNFARIYKTVYQQQWTKANSILYKIANKEGTGTPDINLFPKYVWANNPIMAKWLFPDHKPVEDKLNEVVVERWVSDLLSTVIGGNAVTYHKLEESSKECLRERFEVYLNGLFAVGQSDKIDSWLPKSKLDILDKINHPLYTNGFHSALVLHYLEFLKHLQLEYDATV